MSFFFLGYEGSLWKWRKLIELYSENNVVHILRFHVAYDMKKSYTIKNIARGFAERVRIRECFSRNKTCRVLLLFYCFFRWYGCFCAGKSAIAFFTRRNRNRKEIKSLLIFWDFSFPLIQENPSLSFSLTLTHTHSSFSFYLAFRLWTFGLRNVPKGCIYSLNEIPIINQSCRSSFLFLSFLLSFFAFCKRFLCVQMEMN